MYYTSKLCSLIFLRLKWFSVFCPSTIRVSAKQLLVTITLTCPNWKAVAKSIRIRVLVAFNPIKCCLKLILLEGDCSRFPAPKWKHLIPSRGLGSNIARMLLVYYTRFVTKIANHIALKFIRTAASYFNDNKFLTPVFSLFLHQKNIFCVNLYLLANQRTILQT